MTSLKIGCILIAYCPEIITLKKSVMLLSRQVDKIFVGDNTPEGTFSAAEQIVQVWITLYIAVLNVT